MHGFVQGNTDQFVPWRAPPWRMPAGTVGTWGGAGETALFGDMGVKDIDKARAVRVAVEALGADMADTVAMGDAKVDIPMFEACATSVCMGSGGEEARAAAGFVTTRVDDDGLWNAYSHLHLI